MNQKRIIEILSGIIAIIIIAVLASLTQFIPPSPYGVVTASLVSLLAYSFVDRALNFVFGSEKRQPHIEIEPLPHHKGYTLMGTTKAIIIGNGEIGMQMTNDRGATDEERRICEPSQVVDVYWPGAKWKEAVDAHAKDPEWKGRVIENPPVSELILKFGVLRFFVSDSDAKGCITHIGYSGISDGIHADLTNIRPPDIGHANWFSSEARAKLMQDQATHDRYEKEGQAVLTEVLRHPEETIRDGEHKDLLLFYMLKGHPNVFFCTGAGVHSPGLNVNDKPVRFRVNVSVSAENYAERTWRYECSVRWDDFTIRRI